MNEISFMPQLIFALPTNPTIQKKQNGPRAFFMRRLTRAWATMPGRRPGVLQFLRNLIFGRAFFTRLRTRFIARVRRQRGSSMRVVMWRPRTISGRTV